MVGQVGPLLRFRRPSRKSAATTDVVSFEFSFYGMLMSITAAVAVPLCGRLHPDDTLRLVFGSRAGASAQSDAGWGTPMRHQIANGIRSRRSFGLA